MGKVMMYLALTPCSLASIINGHGIGTIIPHHSKRNDWVQSSHGLSGL